MASDKVRAAIGFVKIVISLSVGYALAMVWQETRGGLDEWYYPYVAGLISAAMVFILLSKMNKGAD